MPPSLRLSPGASPGPVPHQSSDAFLPRLPAAPRRAPLAPGRCPPSERHHAGVRRRSGDVPSVACTRCAQTAPRSARICCRRRCGTARRPRHGWRMPRAAQEKSSAPRRSGRNCGASCVGMLPREPSTALATRTSWRRKRSVCWEKPCAAWGGNPDPACRPRPCHGRDVGRAGSPTRRCSAHAFTPCRRQRMRLPNCGSWDQVGKHGWAISRSWISHDIWWLITRLRHRYERSLRP